MRPSAPKVRGLRKPSSSRANTKIALLERERDEALEQQKATAEVLRVISQSKFELHTVLESVAGMAARLCRSDGAVIFQLENGVYRFAAGYSLVPAYLEIERRTSICPGPGTIIGRAAMTRGVVRIDDAWTDPLYEKKEDAKVEGNRSMIGVPLMRDGEPVAVIGLGRRRLDPFGEHEIELATAFAAQALVAIENTRLLNALRQRTDDLTESLEQQTATSEVLEVISRSAFDLQAVFETVAESSVRLCGADRAFVFRFDGELLRMVAAFNAPRQLKEFIAQNPIRPGRGSTSARAALERRTVHVPDVLADPEYSYGSKNIDNLRTVLGVPILKADDLLGVLTIYHLERVRPFTDKQIALVETFADQAAIAIENVRLFEAEQQRTRELSESLEQQTATSEVLSVISSSPGKLEPVFQAMLKNAVRICSARFGHLWLREGNAFRIGAMHGAPPAFVDYLRSEQVYHPKPMTGLGELMRIKKIFHLEDVAALPTHGDKLRQATINLAGARTLVGVPMVKDNEVIGAIVIYRQEVRPFTDKQIELVQNFAAQAVIAIENTRLLNELRQRTDDLSESLEQQTATSEVLRVISSSPGELEPVFQAMLENAVRICEAKFGTLFRFDGKNLDPAAYFGTPPELVEFQRQRGPYQPIPGSLLERVIRTKQATHTADRRAEPASSPTARLGGARSQIAVPMLKDDALIGAIVIYRQEVRPFTDKQIELVQNFAAQAVIAIENTRLLNELRQRTTDLTESLEQQTATSEVLSVISSSPGELEPVFRAMLENAARICEAKFGVMFRFDDDVSYVVATLNLPLAVDDFFHQRGRVKPTPGSDLDSLWKSKQVVHTLDMSTSPTPSRIAKLAGVRTQLAVPMLLNNKLIGAINLHRQEVRPFTDKQIALVQNFAAQAVIAIENTRLLNELRQRTDDLTESLEQQTATSEVLSVISSSPGELQPVFDTMLAKATRLCEGNYGAMWLREGDAFRTAALHGDLPAAYLERWRRGTLFRPGPHVPMTRVATTREPVHVPDMRADPSYLEGDPLPVSVVEVAGVRSLFSVPMLRENEFVGCITIYRKELRPFTDKQIALVQNFAAQAVIAIENTRLLNELRQRTVDLTESLEQQTATSEVLQVISSSPGELEPVFQAMLENATRICEAKFGHLYRWDGEALSLVAMLNTPPALAEVRKHSPLRPSPNEPIGRMIAAKSAVHVADVTAEATYIERSDPGIVSAVEIGGIRTILAVPLLKERELLGALTVYRQEVRPFTDKQIELVSNFAAQAVIAIENTRLLNELRESLQQQTATSDVLKIISRSTFDLKTVLNTLVESAARLCDADLASIPRQAGAFFDHIATYGYNPAFQALLQRNPMSPGRGTITGRVVLERKTVHIPDVLNDPEYEFIEGQKTGGYRTILGVPLMRDGGAIGVLIVGRSEPRPFTAQQIELAETFADQAVIAIENVRLFDEIQDKSRQLEVASQHKSQFLANMSHELRTPLNAILGYTELMADGIYGELPEKTMAVLKRLESNGRHLLGLINDVLDLSKIEAGQLVLELTDYSLEDIAQTVRSTLEPLAVDKKLAFKVEVAPKLPAGHGDGRRLTQVLINLVGNAIKFTDTGEVVIKGTESDGSFHLSVCDTGPGISAADQAKLFQEFQQADNAITRKKGGTGLGLAISKRIIEMHGGKIWLESQVGQGSTFAFTVPVRVVRQVEPV